MDESGSIGTKELEHFSGHINKIIESCNPEQVIVLHTDSAVGKVEEFGPDDFPIKFKSYCGGGTDMAAGVRWVNDQGLEPDVFVTLTDGYTPWPGKQTFPMAWLITTEGIEAPHGETIHYEVTE
jgi:predicted metal-dependent peptidase